MMKKESDKKIGRAVLLTAFIIAVIATACLGASHVAFLQVTEDIAKSFDAGIASEGDVDIIPCSEEVEHKYLAEISYNNLLLRDGKVVRKLQIWINFNEVLSGTEGTQRDTVIGLCDMACNGVVALLKSNGFAVEEHENYIEVPLESFDSLTDMYIAYGYDGYMLDEDDSEVQKGLFFNQITSISQSPFREMEGSAIDSVVYTLTMIPGVTYQNVALVYNYGTKYSPNLISSDADNIYYYKGEGIYIHKFIMTVGNTDRTFTYTQMTPNTLSWYGFALGGTVVLALISWLLACIMEKRKKNK